VTQNLYGGCGAHDRGNSYTLVVGLGELHSSSTEKRACKNHCTAIKEKNSKGISWQREKAYCVAGESGGHVLSEVRAEGSFHVEKRGENAIQLRTH